MLQALVKNETERALLQQLFNQGGAVGVTLKQQQEVLQLHETFKSLWPQLLVCRRSNLMSLIPLVSQRLEQLPAAGASLAAALQAQLLALQPQVDRLAVFASAHKSTAQELHAAGGAAAALAAEKSALAQVESQVVDSLTQLTALSRRAIQDATAAAAAINSTQPLQQQQVQQLLAQQGLPGPSASRDLQQGQLQLQQQQQTLQRLLQLLQTDPQQQQQPSNAAARLVQTSPAAGQHITLSAPPSSSTTQSVMQRPKQRRQQEQQHELHTPAGAHLQSFTQPPAQLDRPQQLPDPKRRRFSESSEPQHGGRTLTTHGQQLRTQLRSAHGLPGPLTAGLLGARGDSSGPQQLHGSQEQEQQQQQQKQKQQQQHGLPRQVLSDICGQPSSVQALAEPQRSASLPPLAAPQQPQQHLYPDCSALEQTVLAVARALATSKSSLQGAASSQPHVQNQQQQQQQQPEVGSQQGLESQQQPQEQQSVAPQRALPSQQQQPRRVSEGSSALKGSSWELLAAVKAELCEGDPALGPDSQPGGLPAEGSAEAPITNRTERQGSGQATNLFGPPHQTAAANSQDEKSSSACRSGAQQAPQLMERCDAAAVPAGDA